MGLAVSGGLPFRSAVRWAPPRRPGPDCSPARRFQVRRSR